MHGISVVLALPGKGRTEAHLSQLVEWSPMLFLEHIAGSFLIDVVCVMGC